MRLFLVAAILAATVAPVVADPSFTDRFQKFEPLHKAQARPDTPCGRLGGVRIGFTAEGVRKSCWGKPARINTTMTAGHMHEQWVYDGGQYVYLTDGVVTAAQATR